MICTVLPVPPPSIRPSARTETGQRREDDLTHILCNIIKSNNKLRDRIERGAPSGLAHDDVPDGILVNLTQLLQYHVATLIKNRISGLNPLQQRTGRPLKSLTDRLKSKQGRIRSNLMGKRVNFSARSVITPDPSISIDEVGVPIKIAMNMTFPEIVNRYNNTRLTDFVRNGPDVYPGAKYVKIGSERNRTIVLRNVHRGGLVLKHGDIVERHLIDGDYVLFNRQPTLHRMNMMCHRVRVMPYNTFRLNVCACACYNADKNCQSR